MRGERMRSIFTSGSLLVSVQVVLVLVCGLLGLSLFVFLLIQGVRNFHKIIIRHAQSILNNVIDLLVPLLTCVGRERLTQLKGGCDKN